MANRKPFTRRLRSAWNTLIGREEADAPALGTGIASNSDQAPAASHNGAEPPVIASAKMRQFLPDLSESPIRPPRRAPLRKDRQISRFEGLAPRPRISVVLGSLNRRHLLQVAIESVRRNLEGEAGEIIVVDGGSDDGSIEWLTRQEDVITILQYNRYREGGRAMRRRSWGGFMNMGFRAAAGEYIVMISDDCLLLPGAIQAGVERIGEARRAGLQVGSCAFYFRNWPEEKEFYVQRTLGGNLMVNHGIYMRDALEAAGYANEDEYVFYKADTDLSLKIWQQGFCVIDSPASICEHYVGVEEALRASNNAVADFDRSQMRSFWPELTVKKGVSKMGKIFSTRSPDREADQVWGDLYRQEERAARQRAATQSIGKSLAQ